MSSRAPARTAALLVLAALGAACSHAPAAPARTAATAPTADPPAPPPPVTPAASGPATAESGAPGGSPAPSVAPPPAYDLAPVRAGADAVLRRQAEGAWRLFTEGKPFDAGAAWTGHEALLSDATLTGLARAAASGPPDARGGAAALRAWLIGERLARDTLASARELAAARATAQFLWADHLVPVRDTPGLLAAERDRERRRLLSEAARPPAQRIMAAGVERTKQLAGAAAALGYASPLALAAELRGRTPEELGALAEETLSATDATWKALVASLARAEGMAADEVRLRDLPRLLRVRAPARLFPAHRQAADAAALLSGLGLDLSTQANLHLDTGLSPARVPRAIAIPVDPPGDVRLSVGSEAGLEALRGTLHELAVAEAAALGPGAAPVEVRRLPPAWYPGAFGRLVEEAASDRAWLTAHGASDEDAQAEARAAAARRLLRARDAAARLLAALAPPGSGGAALASRAYGVPVDDAEVLPWTLDPDPLLRTAESLRGELLAAAAEARLETEAGADTPWWRSPAAGALLRSWWAAGAPWTPEALAQRLGARKLDPATLDRRVRVRAGL